MSEEIKLESIDIKSFRGIKNTHIEFKNKSLVLVGENGSGKSSIINALEYLFTGRVETLKGKQSINHDNSIVHMGDDKNDLLIEAKINKKTMKRTIDNLECDDDLREIIDDFKNASFILNRKKLLEFIDATQGERYKRISSLIGLNKLDEIEKTFRKTQRQFKQKAEIKNQELSDKTAKIADILNCQESEIYDRINETLTEHNLENISPKTNLKTFLKDSPINNFEKTVKLDNILKSFDLDFNQINENFEQLLADYNEATLYELKSTSRLLDILNKTNEYINDENPKTCPVCNSHINNKKVLKYIHYKKKDLQDNENTLIAWQDAYKIFNKQLVKFNNQLENLELYLSDSGYKSNLNLDDLIRNLEKLADFEINLSDIDSNTIINLETSYNQLKTEIQRDFDNLDNSNNENLINIYEAIIDLNEQKNIENELKEIEKQFEISDNTYELFQSQKQKFLTEIIEEIQVLVEKYYNFIHVDEDFNSPKIDVPKSKQIKLDLNFNNLTADPRSYSSEGHLDTLGLCIFLAFAKKFNKYNFIVLDDIISTVDINHKEKIAMLVLNEFKDYQFIITTHSKLWFRQLKNYVNNNNMEQKYIFCEIKSLDPIRGPLLTENMFSKELIEKYIEMGDTFAAGNGIRRYLENLFEKICMINSIPLPLKKHYMVDDYFKAIKKFFFKSKLLNSNSEIKQYYTEVFDNLDSSRYMGNLLSHNDEDNLDVSISEVEKFRDAVYTFEKSMKCTKGHDAILRFNVNGKFAICSKEKCMEKISFKKQ